MMILLLQESSHRVRIIFALVKSVPLDRAHDSVLSDLGSCRHFVLSFVKRIALEDRLVH